MPIPKRSTTPQTILNSGKVKMRKALDFNPPNREAMI
jgi:hypothetical protein